MEKPSVNADLVKAFVVLGINPPTSIEEVDRVFKRLAKLYHTDTQGGDKDKFQEITAAREILKKHESDLATIRLNVGTSSTSSFEELANTKSELIDRKKTIADLEKQRRIDAASIENYKARLNAKLQLALGFAAFCLCGLFVAVGFIYFDAFKTPKEPMEPVTISIDGGEFPLASSIGNFSLKIDRTEELDTQIIIDSERPSPDQTEALVKLEPGARVVGSRLLLPDGKRFRISAQDVHLLIGRADYPKFIKLFRDDVLEIVAKEMPPTTPAPTVAPTGTPVPTAAPAPDATPTPEPTPTTPIATPVDEKVATAPEPVPSETPTAPPTPVEAQP